MRFELWLPAAVLMMLGCAGCERFPQDPRGSLEQALARGTLRIGVTESPPWVTRKPSGGAGGPEGKLLAEFASELGVRIEWRWGGAEQHLDALERFELDIVAGGFTKTNPWKKRVGLTIPYYTSRAVVGVTGDAAPGDLDGVTIAARPGSGLTEKLEGRGAEVAVRQNLRDFEGPIAAEAWEMEQLGRRSTGIELRKHGHVLAVPPGENALLVRLERFLLERADESRVQTLLRGATGQ